jgi:hypothetical protein
MTRTAGAKREKCAAAGKIRQHMPLMPDGAIGREYFSPLKCAATIPLLSGPRIAAAGSGQTQRYTKNIRRESGSPQLRNHSRDLSTSPPRCITSARRRRRGGAAQAQAYRQRAKDLSRGASAASYRARRTSKMIMGMGIPNNQSRIGICVPPFSLPSSWNEAAFIPRSVAVLATLDGRETGREGAK